MPGLHSPIDKPLFIYDGLVKTSGASGNLAKGQFAIVTDKAVVGGLKVVSDFAGLPKDAPIKFMVGRHKLPTNLRSPYAQNYATSWFTSKDVVSIKANFPKFTKRTFDEILIGYDGINDDTAITLDDGQSTVLDVNLYGKPIEVFSRGEYCDYAVKIHFGKMEGETDQEVVNRAAESLKNFTLPGGKPLTDLVDVKVVDSTRLDLDGVPYVFSTLTIADSGDSNALAIVQAQYSYEVVRTDRKENVGQSIYTILHPVSVSLADYSHALVDASIKDCAACLAGYTDIVGGVVYHVNLEDDGTSQTALVDDLPGYVATTVAKVGQKDGVGTYSIVLDNALTDAEIATFIATNAISATAELKLIGSIAEVCTKTTTTTQAWVDGTTCYASIEEYTIQLKDTECGTSRLTELQAAYPSLVIEEGVATGDASRTVTLTGTSGTANIKVGTTNYLATFATDLTTTAANFVTTHAAAILAAKGLVVTAALGVLTFVGVAEGFPAITITNATTNLAGTLGTLDYVTTASTGGCQRVYSTTVVTDVVCDECSKIFVDEFTSVAPDSFDFTEWDKVEPLPSETAKMGIKLKGKAFDFFPDEASRDEMPFYETSTRIGAVGGYIETDYLNFAPVFGDIFAVKRLSRAQDRDSLGYNFLAWEEVSRAHYLGETRMEDNQFAKAQFGEESVLRFKSQYVTYEVVFDDRKYSQGAGGRSQIGHAITVIAEFGYHTAIESLLNKLAAKAGVDIVNPTAN